MISFGGGMKPQANISASMRAPLSTYTLIKVLLSAAMLCVGVAQILISHSPGFVPVGATLLEADSETYTYRSQERDITKTRYHFRYQYAIEGQTYISGRYAHVYKQPNLGVTRFHNQPRGTSFTVYVHPRLRWYAVVDKDLSSHFVFVLAITGLIGLFHCLFERKLTRLMEANVPNGDAGLERTRIYFKYTGAATALGIFVTALLMLLGW